MMNNFFVLALRLFFSITSRVMPFVAVSAAEKLFTTPLYSKRRDMEQELLEQAQRFSIPMDRHRPLVGYRWGKKSDPIILFVHGWTSTATCFVNFIEPLLDMGYQVISYDSIAHGDSPGMSVAISEWADTIIATMASIGHVHCIIGHSLGSGAIVIASSLQPDTNKLILISPLSDIVEVTEQFAKTLAIPAKTMAKMRHYAWQKYHYSVSKYGSNWQNVFSSDFKVPTLIIHDKNDREINISHARTLARQWPWADFIETKRLGHRRILFNPDVIKSVIKFL